MAPGLRVVMSAVEGLTDQEQMGNFPFRFQVPPLDEFERGYGYEHQDYQALDHKTHSRKTAKQLATVQFATMFLDWDPTWVVSDTSGRTEGPEGGQIITGPDPLRATKALIEICTSGTAFRLVAHQAQLWNGRTDVDMKATLRSLTVAERAGELDARYVNVSFTEYNPPEAAMAEIDRIYPDVRLPARVTVDKRGYSMDSRWGTRTGSPDVPVTLYDLAKRYYGNPNRWRVIARRNGLTDLTPSRSLGEWITNLRGGRPVTLVLPAVEEVRER